MASAEQFGQLLASHNVRHNKQWLRCIGYHPSVAGEIDRHWLDRYIPDRPVRVQHRGGRLWVLNSRALSALGPDSPPGLEQVNGQSTGRLYEADQWLRDNVPLYGGLTPFASRQLASYGITGITDTTPSNGLNEWQLFSEQQRTGALLQRIRMMGI